VDSEEPPGKDTGVSQGSGLFLPRAGR